MQGRLILCDCFHSFFHVCSRQFIREKSLTRTATSTTAGMAASLALRFRRIKIDDDHLRFVMDNGSGAQQNKYGSDDYMYGQGNGVCFFPCHGPCHVLSLLFCRDRQPFHAGSF